MRYMKEDNCLKSKIIYIAFHLFCCLYEFLSMLSQVYLHGRDKVNTSYVNECEDKSNESLPHYLLCVPYSHILFGTQTLRHFFFCNNIFDRKIVITCNSLEIELCSKRLYLSDNFLYKQLYKIKNNVKYIKKKKMKCNI